MKMILSSLLFSSSCIEAFVTTRLVSRVPRAFSSPKSVLAASTSLDQLIPSQQQQQQQEGSEDASSVILNTLESIGEATLESLSQEDEEYEVQLAEKRRSLEQRFKTSTMSTFTISFPLQKQQFNNTALGLVLSQVENGTAVGQSCLDMDSLSTTPYSNFVSKQQDAASTTSIRSMTRNEQASLAKMNFCGVAVLAVDTNGLAWQQGVRPGDILCSTSATVGKAMWKKSSLEGVVSAISSRRSAHSSSTSAKMQFQFQHLMDVAWDNQFELSIKRPTGLEVEQDGLGHVVVTGIGEAAPKLVRYAVRVGDRILAVDSAVGDAMWPVSTVEGVVSACNARLPGKPVRIRFERPLALLQQPTVSVDTTASTPILDQQPVSSTMSKEKHSAFMSRCQDILLRYKKTKTTVVDQDFTTKFSLPSLVADKVVDSVSSASTYLDKSTLSMLLTAYLSCNEPQKALDLFEAAVGVKADGTPGQCTQQGFSLVPNPRALTIYTVTSLMKAQAKVGNLDAIQRILCALEGRAGAIVAGQETAAWPGTSATGETRLVANTTCYNVALAAVAHRHQTDKRRGTKNNGNQIAELLWLFDAMKDAKNLVSYNTVLSALTKAGHAEKAMEIFRSMSDNDNVEPDKVTYTSVLRSCRSYDEMMDLFHDMKSKGIQPDLMTYNTMIRALTDKKQFTRAREIISLMEIEDGLSPDAMTYSLLMRGFLRAKKYHSCLSLFETALADSETSSVTENLHLYTTAISAAAALEDMEKAFELVNQMNMVGLKPNMKTMTALMDASLISDRPEVAVDIYQKMKNPDKIAMERGLIAMIRTGTDKHYQTVLDTLKSESRSRRHHNTTLMGKEIFNVYEVLIRCALRRNELNIAREAFTQLTMKYIPPKTIFYSILDALELSPKGMRHYNKVPRRDHLDFLLFVMDRMAIRNLPLDSSFYCATLRAGGRMGGLERKICTLIAATRGKKRADYDLTKTRVKWEQLLHNYDNLKDKIITTNGGRQEEEEEQENVDDDRIMEYSSVQVNIAGQEQLRQVLLAEEDISYKDKRAKRSKKIEIYELTKPKIYKRYYV